MSLLVRTSACQAMLLSVWQTTKSALVATDSMSATGWTKARKWHLRRLYAFRIERRMGITPMQAT